MATLADVFKDITSRISDRGISSQRLVRKDVVNAINDAIRSTRLEYVSNGRGHDLAVSESVTPTTLDTNYPNVYSIALSDPVEHSFPLPVVVLNSVVTVNAESIPDGTDTFTTGDQKIKDNRLYEAVSDGSDINAFDLTFKAENIKNYYDGNGLKFSVGDIAYNQSDGTYWECDTEYTNNQDETISDSGAFTQVYWRQIGDAYEQASPVDFQSLHRLSLRDKISNYYPISIKESKLYTIVGDIDYLVTYVPEWQDETTFSNELDVPDSLLPQIKQGAIQTLAVKLGIEYEPTTDE